MNLSLTRREISAKILRCRPTFSWGEAKASLFVVMNEKLKGPGEIYDSLMKDKGQVDKLLKEGAKKARSIAMENMQKIRKNLMGY